jgi:molecular chaperone HtpG
MSDEQNKETHGFQAEVKQLLQLMIHAMYSNKEVFLRELVSNASDALDTLRFQGLKDDKLYENDPDLAIWVDFDPEARTVAVRDNGIGMSRDEVIERIGTIAKSGTKTFLESLSGDEQKDARLIGQFGVGFYSSFIVAERVVLTTRRAGEREAVRWESDGGGEYTIETVGKPQRGTEAVLHLREGGDEFLDAARLKELIRRYSDHIAFPIKMRAGKENEWQQVNRGAPLWARPKSEIAESEYRGFYKHIAHDFDDPLTWSHNKVEGSHEYTSLLYIPKRAPFDLWDPQRKPHGVKLYVQRVFILDDAEHLLPRYLRFVRGMVDSNDLPLNVSRELLQSNRVIDKIRAGSVKKVLALIEEMTEKRPDDYAIFWSEFGAVLKEGVVEDPESRETIAGLLRFPSTRDETVPGAVSLARRRSTTSPPIPWPRPRTARSWRCSSRRTSRCCCSPTGSTSG